MNTKQKKTARKNPADLQAVWRGNDSRRGWLDVRQRQAGTSRNCDAVCGSNGETRASIASVSGLVFTRLNMKAEKTIETRRLIIRGFRYPHCSGGIDHVMYVATLRNIDWPGPVVVASVFPDDNGTIGGHYLDWIETTTPNRRQGFATEMLQALVHHVGKIIIEPASDDGEAWIKGIGVIEKMCAGALTR